MGVREFDAMLDSLARDKEDEAAAEEALHILDRGLNESLDDKLDRLLVERSKLNRELKKLDRKINRLRENNKAGSRRNFMKHVLNRLRRKGS